MRSFVRFHLVCSSSARLGVGACSARLIIATGLISFSGNASPKTVPPRQLTTAVPCQVRSCLKLILSFLYIKVMLPICVLEIASAYSRGSIYSRLSNAFSTNPDREADGMRTLRYGDGAENSQLLFW
jgi:hypothetical protein